MNNFDRFVHFVKLDQEQSLFFSHYDPETVEFLTGLVR